MNSRKIFWSSFILLIFCGIGVLEIQFPHAMDNFEDNYTGRGWAGVILFLIELFFRLSWGKAGGIFIITAGFLIATWFLMPEKRKSFSDELSEEDASNEVINSEVKDDSEKVSLAIKATLKDYLDSKRAFPKE